MGIKLFGGSSSYQDRREEPRPTVSRVTNGGNPNPYKYKIGKSFSANGFLVVKINYPDCKNYEGDKILVFKNISLDKLKRLDAIDPHFLNEGVHPVARFTPTKEGWDYAIHFVKTFEN